MECMCAQTRPRFILSSERVLGEWSKNPCNFQLQKSPLPEAQRRCEPATLHHTGQQAQHTTNWAILAPSAEVQLRDKEEEKNASQVINHIKITTCEFADSQLLL